MENIKISKQELAANIWAGANALRGKVSAASYKDYMLGLIFYKYLAEKEIKYLREKKFFEDEDIKALSEDDHKTVETCQKNLGYFIAYKNTPEYWNSIGTDFQIKNLRDALNAFNRLIDEHHQKVFHDIFKSLALGLDSFGTMESERTKALSELTALIDKIPMDGRAEYDVLGFVYEFLLKNFAANAGKAGEFYTPHEASEIMSKIIAHHLKGRAEVSIYDPTSGSASLETSLLKELTKTMKINKIKVYAQELIENTYNLTRMNLVMRDVLPDNLIVRNGDTLAQDWPFFEDGDDAERRINTYRLETVDACCSNPPYSQAWDTTKADSDARFKDYGIAPKSKADYAFLLHNLYHLANDGIMAIVLPHGVLFRGGEEENIRRELIERSNIETIIGLPANIFFGTGIPTIIMILKKQRESDDILFVDASKGFIKDGNKNRLQAKDVQRIVDTVLTRNPDPKESDFARLVSKEEIVEKNEYNLNISRYIKPKKEIKNYDLYATMYGGIPNYEIDDLFKPWENFRKLKSELFEPISEKYSCLKTTDVSNILNSNSEIESFRGQYFSVIDNIVNLINDEIVLKAENININDIEVPLYDKIRGYMNGLPIINYYDIYQIVSNQWNNITWDLELIQNDGLSALNIVKPNMIKKKKKNSKELIDVQDGWLGNILPFDLIQEEYFKDDKTRIEKLFEKLKSLDNEKQETIDAIDVNDKTSILKENSEEVESAKLTAEIKRVKKEIKKGFEVEEDSYESLIMKIEALNSSIKKTKDELKTLKVLIEENTKSKIESLEINEAVKCLFLKWCNPIINDMKAIFDNLLLDFNDKIISLYDKYKVTYEEVANNINESKASLSNMMKSLKGNEEDTKAINELSNLLRGEAYERN